MLKKYVSSLAVVTLLLAGCTTETDDTVTIEQPTSTVEATAEATEETTESKAGEEAAALVSTLDLGDTMGEINAKAIAGLFFNGDTSLYTDASVYFSNVSGNSDTVAVFFTKDVDDVKENLSTYIANTKSNAEAYFGEEVTKFDNAVVEANDEQVILVICTDASAAQSAVEDILEEK